ncbi:Hypp3211 [Branchiostoma lanceolatum]|uniref:Hypp3211 protein n=1 Tax=Branchiostoma lanceolatum TaxID=7740 RepID=A0A8K0ETL5_BRALA|nr:Hypp3211 [Branchiostoma lanceolatum]
MWNVKALQDFLRVRGWKTTGPKVVLEARALCAWENNVPVQPSAAENVATVQREYRQLVEGLPDPLQFKDEVWLTEAEGLEEWPNVMYFDICDYLMKDHPGKDQDLNSRILNAYKEGKAFTYYSSGWLQEVYCCKRDGCVYLRAKCRPSARVNDIPHNVWVCCDPTGTVKRAYCSCTAGLGQTCNHIAALLFTVEAAVRTNMVRPACTSTACKWNAAPGKAVQQSKVKEMSFKKDKFGKTDSRPVTSTRKKLFQPVEDSHQLSGDEKRARLSKALRPAVPEAVFLTALEEQCHKDERVSGQPLSPQSLSMDAMARPYTYLTLPQFISSFVISKDDVDIMEKATRGQASSPIWSMARRGRLTASNFYTIYTKVQTIKKKPDTTADALLARIMGYRRTSGNVPELQYGRDMEDNAKKSLLEEFSKEHEGAQCKQIGLVLSNHKAYLGASPDALLTCKCHDPQVAEIKCPHSCKDTMPSANVLNYLYDSSDGVKLKTNHAYYAQCQGQMALTGCKLCSFYVFSKYGSIKINLEFDEKYWEEMSKALDFFFVQYVAPELLTGTLKQKLDARNSAKQPECTETQAACSCTTKVSNFPMLS